MKINDSLVSISLLTAIVLMLIIVAMQYFEMTGYSFFETSDNKNVLCSIDPTCRPLTSDENDLFYLMFGDQLDTKKIKVFYRKPFFRFRHDVIAAAYGETNLYIGKEFKDIKTSQKSINAFLIHEAAHLWQNQNNIESGDITLPGDPGNKYEEWDISTGDYLDTINSFSDFDTETQANIMMLLYQVYYDLEQTEDKNEIIENCGQLKQYNKKLATFLTTFQSEKCDKI